LLIAHVGSIEAESAGKELSACQGPMMQLESFESEWRVLMIDANYIQLLIRD